MFVSTLSHTCCLTFYLNTSHFYIRDEEVPSEGDAPGTTRTSTYQTLAIAEDPEIPPKTTESVKSPRALRKKPRTKNANKGVVIAEDSSTPHMNDVSFLFLLFNFFDFSFVNVHFLILISSYASRHFLAYNKGNGRHS
jgi:hypothetical protein